MPYVILMYKTSYFCFQREPNVNDHESLLLPDKYAYHSFPDVGKTLQAEVKLVYYHSNISRILAFYVTFLSSQSQGLLECESYFLGIPGHKIAKKQGSLFKKYQLPVSLCYFWSDQT